MHMPVAAAPHGVSTLPSTTQLPRLLAYIISQQDGTAAMQEVEAGARAAILVQSPHQPQPRTASDPRSHTAAEPARCEANVLQLHRVLRAQLSACEDIMHRMGLDNQPQALRAEQAHAAHTAHNGPLASMPSTPMSAAMQRHMWQQRQRQLHLQLHQQRRWERLQQQAYYEQYRQQLHPRQVHQLQPTTANPQSTLQPSTHLSSLAS